MVFDKRVGGGRRDDWQARSQRGKWGQLTPLQIRKAAPTLFRLEHEIRTDLTVSSAPEKPSKTIHVIF